MTNPQDPIQPLILRQISDTEYRIASIKDQNEGRYLSSTQGLTKREYLAAMAMQGILANSESFKSSPETLSEWAVEQADLLIKELNKQQ